MKILHCYNLGVIRCLFKSIVFYGLALWLCFYDILFYSSQALLEFEEIPF